MVTDVSSPKDPDDVDDFYVDFVNLLEDGETISTRTVTPQSGITVDSSSIDGTKVVARLSGGTDGERYVVAFKITTSNARTLERSIRVHVAHQ